MQVIPLGYQCKQPFHNNSLFSAQVPLQHTFVEEPYTVMHSLLIGIKVHSAACFPSTFWCFLMTCFIQCSSLLGVVMCHQQMLCNSLHTHMAGCFGQNETSLRHQVQLQQHSDYKHFSGLLEVFRFNRWLVLVMTTFSRHCVR